MNDSVTYTPPKVWTWNTENGGRFANINRPTAARRTTRNYQSANIHSNSIRSRTPNGEKITIMLEELLALGHRGAEYDAWPIKIMKATNSAAASSPSNPNSKIPALVDRSGARQSGSSSPGPFLLYLAEKFGALLPTERGPARSASPGYFGKWAAHPFSAAGSVISMPTRRPRSSMPSTVSQWR